MTERRSKLNRRIERAPWCNGNYQSRLLTWHTDRRIPKSDRRQASGAARNVATRFQDFDAAAHPCNQWWEKHGQYMMSGGGRRQFIWACRGWIAREQLMEGVDVTGDSLYEQNAPAASCETTAAGEGRGDECCDLCGGQLGDAVCTKCYYDRHSPALEEMRQSRDAVQENRDYFCHWVNEIARLFWGDDKQCYSPEATFRKVKEVLASAPAPSPTRTQPATEARQPRNPTDDVYALDYFWDWAEKNAIDGAHRVSDSDTLGRVDEIATAYAEYRLANHRAATPAAEKEGE